MILYFIQTERDRLDKFEAFRKLINNKKNTEALSQIMEEMIDVLKDKDKIIHLSNEYKTHFLSGAIKWQMAYDISINLLTRESKSEQLNYAYTLIHYFFYYLLLPVQFKCTFFLQHGMAVEINAMSKAEIIKNQQYVVCKKNQELLNTYILSSNGINNKLEPLVNQFANTYSIQVNSEKSSNILLIIQLSDSKS